jgi:hypothetical protein
MAKRSQLEKHKGRRAEGGFFRLTHFVLRSPQFRMQSPRAKAVFLALAAEYNGKNNGSLALPRSQMAENGFGVNGDQAKGGIEDLIAAGFIVRTRKGSLNYGPAMYALTTEPIDASDKHNHPSSNVATHLWRKTPCTETVQAPARKPCKQDQNSPLTCTETVPTATEIKPIACTETVHLYRSTKRSGFAAASAVPASSSESSEISASKGSESGRPPIDVQNDTDDDWRDVA